MTTHVLYNELSGNGTGKTKAEDVKKFLNGKETVFEDVRKITDYNSFFAGLKEDDEIILCGGDGTLNHFINDTEGMTYENPLYYYPTGSGNDFLVQDSRCLHRHYWQPHQELQFQRHRRHQGQQGSRTQAHFD